MKRKKIEVSIKLKDRWDYATVKVVDSDKKEIIARRVNEACGVSVFPCLLFLARSLKFWRGTSSLKTKLRT